MKAVSVAILAIFAVVEAKVVDIWNCEDVLQNTCTVNQLRITQCDRSPCILQTGSSISAEVDITPNFSAAQVKRAVYWKGPNGDVLITPKMDACPHTTCPVVANKHKTLSYEMPILNGLVTGIEFTFQWRLWNEADSAQVCCFNTQVMFK